MSGAVAITNLLYRYAELMDTGDLAGAAALFSHARIKADPEGTVILDHAGILQLWRGLVTIHADGTPRTKHVITNPILDTDEDAGTATRRSYYTVLQQTDAVPLQVIAAGRYHNVPVLTGYTAEEGKLFAPFLTLFGGPPGFKIDDATRFNMMAGFNPDAPATLTEADVINPAYLPATTPASGWSRRKMSCKSISPAARAT